MNMYDMNITTKVRLGTKDAASMLADDEGITLSEFARLGIEEYVKRTLRSILINRFDEVNALSLIGCMGSDDVAHVDAKDVVLEYAIVDGRIRVAIREEIEDALAGVSVDRDVDSGGVTITQNGKEITSESEMWRVVKYDKKLGVLVIA